jgi:hypothetical protein
MGFLDMIKDLLGSSGASEVLESTGLAEHVGGLTEMAQGPLEGLTEVAQGPLEEIGTAAADVTEVIDPLTGQA